MAARPEEVPFELGIAVAEAVDEHTLVELFAEYRKFLTEQMELLKRARFRRRFAEVHRLAHSIRGGALTVQAIALAGVAGELERATKAGESSAIDALIAETDVEVTRFMCRATDQRIGPPV
jgi:HPt (histidine-containing phosphotransfer) domain-containing protein